MEWIAAAIVFLFFAVKYPKPTFIAAGAVAGVGAVAVAAHFALEAYAEGPQRRIATTVEIGADACPTIERPLALTIHNRSNRTVIRSYVEVSGYIPERSTRITQTGRTTDDRIIKPSETYDLCLPVTTADDKLFTPEEIERIAELRWEVSTRRFTFQ